MDYRRRDPVVDVRRHLPRRVGGSLHKRTRSRDEGAEVVTSDLEASIRWIGRERFQRRKPGLEAFGQGARDVHRSKGDRRA